ncbi:hypothetical protein [Nocardioides mangrovi]|uniref:hypothetical protein n=1 Tax=Nocardioides mangrovi TaxID=2874580 RepID=UPI001CC472CE|nr:hypothetical protein [Nocardioides mangrovi]
MTYSVDLSNVPAEVGRSARTAAVGSLVLALASLAVLAASGALSWGTGLFVVIGGIAMSVGEAARATSILCRRMVPALWYDVIWTVAMVGLMIGLRPHSPEGVLLIWAGSSIVALLVFSRALGHRPPPSGPSVRQRLGLAMEAMADRGGSQVATLILATGLPATMSAGFTAARNLLAPLNPIAIAVFNLAFPASRDAEAAARGRLIVQNVVVISGGVALVCLGIQLAPRDVMVAVAGPTWDSAKEFVLPVSLSYAAMLYVQAASSVARGAGLAREVRVSRLIAAGLGFFPSLAVFFLASPGVALVVVVSAIAFLGSLQFVVFTWNMVTSKGLMRV